MERTLSQSELSFIDVMVVEKLLLLVREEGVKRKGNLDRAFLKYEEKQGFRLTR
jgi:hypothetical protein